MTLLDALPRPPASRLAVRSRPMRSRRLRAGHPWLFDGSIRSTSREGAAGDLAVVFDDDRRFVAIGLWDPSSPIRLKVLHAGQPAQIDEAWFRAALRTLARPPSAAGRLCVVTHPDDRVPRRARRERRTARSRRRPLLRRRRRQALHDGVDPASPRRRALARASCSRRRASSCASRERCKATSRPARPRRGDVLLGPSGRPLRSSSSSTVCAFEADVVHGQKTGHFLDQRDNRALVGTLTNGARVLDVFCCTGGFTVHAAAGGATAVHSVDTSPFAITATKRNLELNREPRRGARVQPRDDRGRRIRGDGAAGAGPAAIRRRRHRPAVVRAERRRRSTAPSPRTRG